jgi:hypothetical protein
MERTKVRKVICDCLDVIRSRDPSSTAKGMPSSARELFNATGLTAHQAKNLLGRVMSLIELGERMASKTSH